MCIKMKELTRKKGDIGAPMRLKKQKKTDRTIRNKK